VLDHLQWSTGSGRIIWRGPPTQVGWFVGAARWARRAGYFSLAVVFTFALAHDGQPTQ
jgi:hypothetical protein